MSVRLSTAPDSGRKTDQAPNESIDWQPILRVVVALLLGLAISLVAAFMAVEVGILFLIPALFLVPVGVLLVRYPLSAVMLWLLIFPFVVRGSSAVGVPLYYGLHRLMIPGTLWLVIVGSWVGARKRPMIRFGFPEFVMVLSLLWAIGNTILLGHEPMREIIDIYDQLIVPYCMYWLIRLIAPTAEDLKRLLPVVFITLIIQEVIGLASWFFPNALPPDWLGEAGDRVVGTFRNPAVFTSTVLFLTLLVFQYGINSKSKAARAMALGVLALGFFSVIISFSRGSWLGGTLVLLGLIVLYPGTLLRMTIAGSILAVVLGTTVLSREVAFANERLNDAATANSRVLTGAKSLGMIEQRPLFGWGYGNYDIYDDSFRVVNTPSRNSMKESDHTSHNTYFTVMAEQGIPALVLYLLPTGWWLLMSVAVRRKLPQRGFWSVTLLAVLWLLILDHVTVSSFMDMIRFNLFGTTIYWMALALIATVVESHKYLNQESTETKSINGQSVPGLAKEVSRTW